MWMDTYSGEATLPLLFFLSLHLICKGVYSEIKEFAPLGNKFLFFTETSFSEGLGVQETNRNSQILSPPPLKRVCSKRKEFAPMGSKFFPFRTEPSSKGAWSARKQTGSDRYCLPCNIAVHLPSVFIQLNLSVVFLLFVCIFFSIWSLSLNN